MTSIKINYIQYQIQGRDSFVISLLRPTVLHLSSLGESSSAPCQLLSCVCLNLTFDLWKSVIVMNHMCPATSKLLWGQKKLIICSKVLGIYMNIYIYIYSLVYIQMKSCITSSCDIDLSLVALSSALALCYSYSVSGVGSSLWRFHWNILCTLVVQWHRHVWLCGPMDCSTPGFPVLHHLSELAQTHAHWVSDTIQPSYLLSSPSPPAFNLSQHQDLFQWVSSSHQVAKVLELQLHH